MATLHVIKPSVNNMAARVFIRAAGLAVNEEDAFGKTRSTGFLAKCPAHLTPLLEDEGMARPVLWESCAIMQYLANKHGLDELYPSAPEPRALIDSAMFFLTGTFYPLVARAVYPALGFPLYPGEIGAAEVSDAEKENGRRAAEEALAEPLEVFRTFFIADGDFIGGAAVSIADIRFASTLELLPAIDYPLPQWVRGYLSAVEARLGDAYTTPAADVRGYLEYVRSQAAG